MSPLRTRWDEAWYGPVDAARVWLLGRLLLLMLAFDAWHVMVPKGGRYGAGGFNVAHFAWLDALQPPPTTELYVGLVLLVGLGALLGAFGILGRWGLGALAALYTYGWMMSQLDSYQHHYFLTWLLFGLALIPPLDLKEVLPARGAETRPAAPTVEAWAFKLLAATVSLLYLWTGVSKTEEAWRSGTVLVRINRSGGKLEPFRELGASLGLSDEAFWSLCGHSVIGVQWLIAAAYAHYALFGERTGRKGWALRLVGLLSAVSFHVGAEYFELRIGWFSHYMIVIGLGLLLPAAALRAPLRLFTWPWRALVRAAEARADGLRRLGWPLCGACVLVASVGLPLLIDLPGERGAAWLFAASLLALAVLRRRPLASAIAGGIAAAALVLSLGASDARWDYYRFRGGDMLRRLEVQESLDAYGKAHSHAPEGQDRRRKVFKALGALREGQGAGGARGR